METKLWTALCALLLINFGSTQSDGDHAAASPTLKSPLGAETVASVTKPVPDSGSKPTSLPPNGTDTTTGSSGNSKVSNKATTEPSSVISEPRKDTATNVSLTVDGEKNETQKNQPPSQSPPTERPNTEKPTSPADASTSHHTSSADVTATPSPDHNNTHSNTSSHPEPPLPDSTTQSHQDSPTTTPAVVSSSTSEPPKAQGTPNSTTTTTTTTQSTSTSSTSSTHGAATPEHTSQSSSTAHPTTASSPPSSPSTRTHADTPSQLNMGGDAKKDSPALDPLLAGLVSAFIITAVIITLLLFLKLRRRDDRPQFSRLQDLPMDDMMEETPLSMYSY